MTDLLEAVSAGSVAAYDAVPGMTTTILSAVMDAVKTAYSQSFRTVFLVSIAFGGLSVITSLFSAPVDDRFTNDVAAKLSSGGASNQVFEEKKDVESI